MTDVSHVITQGIGTPAGITEFLTLGLQIAVDEIQVEDSDSWAYTGSSAQTESFTCPAGTDVLIVAIAAYDVGVGVESNDLTPDSLTYDGNALTQAVANHNPSTNRQRYSAIYYKTNPTTGSALDLYYDPANTINNTMMFAIALSNCNTSDLIGATHTADINDTDLVEAVTTTYDNSILIAAVTSGNAADFSLTEDGDTAEVGYNDWDVNAYDPAVAGGYRIVGSAGSYDIGWTASSAQLTAFAAVEIRKYSAPAGGNIIPIIVYHRMLQGIQ